MNRVLKLLVGIACLLGGLARAESPVPLVAPEPDVPVVYALPQLDAPSPRLSHLGLAVSADVPSGATAELIFRPWRPLRLEAGVAYDLVSPGVTAGVTLAPFDALISPVLSVHAGRLFEGDASGLLHVDPAVEPLLKRVGYDFASAELGLEIGRADAFAFTLCAGLAEVRSTVHGVDSALSLGTSSIHVADPTVSAVVPAGRVGFVFFI